MTMTRVPQSINVILARTASAGIADRTQLYGAHPHDVLRQVLDNVDTCVLARRLKLQAADGNNLTIVASGRSLISVEECTLSGFGDLENSELNIHATDQIERLGVLLSEFSGLAAQFQIHTSPVGDKPEYVGGVPARLLAKRLGLIDGEEIYDDPQTRFDTLITDMRDYVLAARRPGEDWVFLHDGLSGLNSMMQVADSFLEDDERLSKLLKSDDSIFLALGEDRDLAVGLVRLEAGSAALLVSSDAVSSLAKIWSMVG